MKSFTQITVWGFYCVLNLLHSVLYELINTSITMLLQQLMKRVVVNVKIVLLFIRIPKINKPEFSGAITPMFFKQHSV